MLDRQTKLDLRIIEQSDKGRLGCWQSHLQLYFRVVKSKINKPVLILEDDLHFEADFLSTVTRIIPLLPDNWDMFFISFSGGGCHQGGYRFITSDFCRGSNIWLTSGYFVRNYTVAETLASFSNAPFAQIADGFWQPLFDNNTIVPYMVQPRCVAGQVRARFATDIPSSGIIPDFEPHNPLINFTH